MNVPVLDLSALPPLREIGAALAPHAAAWILEQRWYAAKSRGVPEVRVLGHVVLEAAPSYLVADLVVRASTRDTSTDYQLPIVIRRPGPTDPPREDGAEIAVLAVAGGPLRIDDATRDVDGRASLLRFLREGLTLTGEGLELSGSPVPHRVHGRILSSHLMTGEQSNSSLVVEVDDAAPVILKLFRVLQHGPNPDVDLQTALDAAGSDQVPYVAGSAVLRWHDQPARPDDTAADGARLLTTHGLFAQEFLADGQDAWRLALRAARSGADFTESARELGAATARVHRDLARVLPTTPADDRAAADGVAGMIARLRAARAEVPFLDRHADRLESVLRSAESAPWPDLQRVHGDFHLGQVLSAPGRGWVLLDFEGEPIRPLPERSLPDCPLRDVAGMMRSFDYAAGAVRHEDGVDASVWADRAREAFLSGYLEAAGEDDGDDASRDRARLRDLITVFETDKAIYEALYEVRHRPDWADIPIGALRRLLSGSDAEAE